MQTKPESAVYGPSEMCRLYNCGINEIGPLVAAGTIPKPLPCKVTPRGRSGKRRWPKAIVDKKLGIVTQATPDISAIVAAEVARILGASLQVGAK